MRKMKLPNVKWLKEDKDKQMKIAHEITSQYATSLNEFELIRVSNSGFNELTLSELYSLEQCLPQIVIKYLEFDYKNPELTGFHRHILFGYRTYTRKALDARIFELVCFVFDILNAEVDETVEFNPKNVMSTKIPERLNEKKNHYNYISQLSQLRPLSNFSSIFKEYTIFAKDTIVLLDIELPKELDESIYS
jgi:hypothetical protein